ncbi:MAG: hypothetical protein DHS20C15_09330 [Planctomycetota bacterium]|nr:MAG: hypothetical protein DHS20C15_09330 [Planctomycetota bacterium]
MDLAALILAVLALLAAMSARKRAADLEDKLVALRAEAGSSRQTVDEFDGKFAVQQKFIEALARGDDVDHLMVREGRLYQHLDGKALQAKVEAGSAYVIDVRTAQEWSTGHIPGAAHIPVDELEKRLNEIKRDGTPMHFVCAGGGRSETAAKLVADRGYRHVFNVTGGMQGYRGPTVRD